MRRAFSVLAVAAVLVSGCSEAPVSRDKPELPVLSQRSPDIAYVAIIGDSFTNGSSSGGKGSNGWPEVATSMLKQQGIKIKPVVAASSGAGYVRHSTEGSVPFVNQISRAVGPKDKLVILFGSPYDQSILPDEADRLSITVQNTLAEIRRAAPVAKLLVIGPAWVQPDPSPGILQARDIVRAQAEAIAAPFVDPLDEQWFTDHPEMIGINGDSPNDAGHLLMAQKIAPLIAQQLQAPPVP